jgi:hypothetical protein
MIGAWSLHDILRMGYSDSKELTWRYPAKAITGNRAVHTVHDGCTGGSRVETSGASDW